jgi:hypothetical protein
MMTGGMPGELETLVGIIDASLIAKLTATAAVVLFATLIAERASPFVGAMIVALPVSAGPAYVFLAMEHDDAFIASTALTSLAVNAMICPFLLIAAALVRRAGLVVALTAALATWLAGAYAVLHFRPDMITAIAMNVVAFSVCLLLVRPLLKEAILRAARRGFLDLLLRIVAIVCVVAAVIVCGRLLGPEIAGIAAILPIVWLSTSTVIHARLGADACAAILANGIIGMTGFFLALAALATLIVPYGKTVSLSAALAVCIVWNLGLTMWRRSRMRHAPRR